MDQDDLSKEVDANFDFFQRRISEFLVEHVGEYALLRDRRIVGFYESPGAADRAARAQFRDGIYSIQQVADEPVDLGLYSNGAN